MIDKSTRIAIRQAFEMGQLRVRAVDPVSGCIGLYPIQDVVQHHTSDRPAVTCKTESGQTVVTTCDHSLFQMVGSGIAPVRADLIRSGDQIASFNGDRIEGVVVNTQMTPPIDISYDLCVPGPENFILANGIVAHNTYSIGGISLDLDKSSKYMDLKRNAEEQWDKLTEAKARTTKYIRGLQQPRFGVGVRSAFGPAVGRGVLSPRRFIVWLLAIGGYGVWEALSHASQMSDLFA